MDDCTILIIDDDEDDIGLLTEALGEAGVDRVHYVFSAMQAFIYLEKTEAACVPKLIITDHYLPGITGAEFLLDLKKMKKYEHIHVIVLSTIKSEIEIQRYLEMGALDYVIKPSSYEEYLEVAKDMKKRAQL